MGPTPKARDGYYVVRVAGPDIPAIPFSPPLEEFFLPNPTKIAEAARHLAEY